jgi:hypothetical protein
MRAGVSPGAARRARPSRLRCAPLAPSGRNAPRKSKRTQAHADRGGPGSAVAVERGGRRGASARHPTSRDGAGHRPSRSVRARAAIPAAQAQVALAGLRRGPSYYRDDRVAQLGTARWRPVEQLVDARGATSVNPNYFPWSMSWTDRPEPSRQRRAAVARDEALRSCRARARPPAGSGRIRARPWRPDPITRGRARSRGRTGGSDARGFVYRRAAFDGRRGGRKGDGRHEVGERSHAALPRPRNFRSLERPRRLANRPRWSGHHAHGGLRGAPGHAPRLPRRRTSSS